MDEAEREALEQIIKEVYDKRGKELYDEWLKSEEIKGVWIDEAQFIEEKEPK